MESEGRQEGKQVGSESTATKVLFLRPFLPYSGGHQLGPCVYSMCDTEILIDRTE